MAENKEELKSLLIRVKEESEKPGLKLNIKETKIMATIPITSQQIKGEKIEAVTDFLFMDSKITADANCSHKIRNVGKESFPEKENYNKTRQHIKK